MLLLLSLQQIYCIGMRA